MSDLTNRAGDFRLPSSLLERAPTQKPSTEIQSQVDALVDHSLTEATNFKTLSAMVAGGFAFRFARLGSLEAVSPLLSKGQAALSLLARGSSYALALGAESAVFAGVGRKLNQWEGQKPTQAFTQEWAHAALTLGALKSFGGLTQGQNIVLQHLAADLGLVVGQNLGYAAHLSSKPDGSFAQQMLSAEATNWHLKAGMSLIHSLAPSLLTTEKAMDLILKSQETNLKRPLPFFAQLAAEGVPGDFISKSLESEGAEKSHISAMSKEGEGGSPPATPKEEKPVPGTDEGGLAEVRISDDEIRELTNRARETRFGIFILHLLEMLGLVHQQGGSRSNAVSDAEQFVRSLAGADLRRVKDLLFIDAIRIVPPGPGADPRRVEDAWAALHTVELCLATLQRLDHDGPLFRGLSKSLRILGKLMASENPAPGTVNTPSESELSSPYPSRVRSRKTEKEGPSSPPPLSNEKGKKSSFLPLSLESANKRGGLYQLYQHFPRFEAAVEKTELSPEETRKLINIIREKAGDRAELVFLQLPEFLGWMADARFSSQQILHLAQPFAERGLSHFQYHGLPQFLEVAESAGLSVLHRFELLRRLMDQDFGYDVLHFNRAGEGLENLAKVGLDPKVIFRTAVDNLSRGPEEKPPIQPVKPFVKVEVVEGDLLQQKTEAIVNPYNRNIIPWWLFLFPRGVSGDIKKQGGFGPFRELGKAGKLPLGGAHATSAGKLPFKAIIHVAGLNLLWRASPESIRDSVINAVKEAEARGIKSLAFPLIGSGIGGMSPAEAEKIMLETLSQIRSDIRVVLVRYKK